MTPTQQLKEKLRKLLNEIIPEGKNDTDTRFTDSELEDLLTESASIYAAASTGWTMKAGLLQGQIESYSAGQEKYDMTSLKDQLSHSLAMAEQYAKMAEKIPGTAAGLGSIILKVTPPEVV
ncbi:MAG: hypothetical protein K6T29_09760 [Peptococcaceae bacterium]|nr:hypothetical protein [Peptococcaceae bacterium]